MPDRLHPVPDVGEGVEDGVRADLRLDDANVDPVEPSGNDRDGRRFLVVVGEPCPIVLQPSRELTSQPLQIPTANDLESLELLPHRSSVAKQN